MFDVCNYIYILHIYIHNCIVLINTFNTYCICVLGAIFWIIPMQPSKTSKTSRMQRDDLRISQWEIQKGNIFFGGFLKPIQGIQGYLVGGDWNIIFFHNMNG